MDTKETSKKNNTQDHNLSLKNRKELEIDGVIEVISYDDKKIILKTSLGTLDIKGENLNIQQLNLDDTNIKIEGTINNLLYSNKKTASGILKKMFK